MTKHREYNIIVFSDDHAEHRQFRISKRAILLFCTSFAAMLLVSVAMGVILWQGFSSQVTLAEMRKDNEALRHANDRYLEASIEMERKLKIFDEKTTKLAQYVGVEPVGIATDGIGGPELFDNELSRYLRYDLGLLQDKTQILEERLEELGEVYQTQKEVLDATPSIMPARGWLSSGFSYRKDPFTQQRAWHNGIDISCQKGTPVYAPASGVVTYRGYQGGFGNLLVISHGNGIETKYGHLFKFNVSKGQRVKRGDLIAYVGDSGRSTAPHLHFEIHKDDKSINPLKYIIRDVKTF